MAWGLEELVRKMNMKVDKENGKVAGMVNGRALRVWRYSSNEVWNKIGCLVSAPTFGIGELRLWEKKKTQI